MTQELKDIWSGRIWQIGAIIIASGFSSFITWKSTADNRDNDHEKRIYLLESRVDDLIMDKNARQEAQQESIRSYTVLSVTQTNILKAMDELRKGAEITNENIKELQKMIEKNGQLED